MLRHYVAWRLRQYAELCEAAPWVAAVIAGSIAAVVVNVDLAPKAKLARAIARRLDR